MIAEARPAETVRGHLAAGRLEEAEAAAAAEVERRPSVAGWRTVAAVRLRRGRPDAALAALARAEALAPSDPDVAIDSGVVHRSAGRFAEAAIAFERAARAAPERADAWTRLADAALDAGDLALAGRAVERARTIDPAAAAARLAAGRLAIRRRRFADALAAVAPVADGRRPDPAALELAGRALAALGDDAGAARRFARGFAAERQVRWSRQLAFVLRRSGRFREGAAALAARLDDPRIDVRAAALPQPVWRGEPLAGRRIAVWSQLGVGDEIMMIGQLPALRAAGAEVLLEANERLIPLLARSMPWLALAPARTADDRPADGLRDPAVDFKIGIGDLDAWFPPPDRPRPAYLQAASEAVARRRANYRRLGSGPLVGIAWRSVAAVGAAKSTALADWRAVLTAGPAVFVDVQYGDTREERAAMAAMGVEIHHDPEVDPLRDLDAHASQLAALDMVISTSNTAAHLAGALGVQTWTLLPGPDGLLWYWGGGGDRSPWYDSMRLIRPRPAGTGGIDLEAAAARFADWRLRFGAGEGDHGRA